MFIGLLKLTSLIRLYNLGEIYKWNLFLCIQKKCLDQLFYVRIIKLIFKSLNFFFLFTKHLLFRKIKSVKDGVFRQYTSTRDRDSLWSFIDEKRWKAIEPISKWAHPASIQMTVVSWFFKISMVVRAIHTRLVDDYGIPSYGSYILFGLG